MANGKAIKPAEFKRVKGLIEFGVPSGEIKKLTKLSEGTIWFIRKSKDMADYRKIRSSYYKTKPTKLEIPETKQTPLEVQVKVLEARIAWLESEVRKQATTFVDTKPRKSGWFHTS